MYVRAGVLRVTKTSKLTGLVLYYIRGCRLELVHTEGVPYMGSLRQMMCKNVKRRADVWVLAVRYGAVAEDMLTLPVVATLWEVRPHFLVLTSRGAVGWRFKLKAVSR